MQPKPNQENASSDFNAEGEIIALRIKVENLQRQVDSMLTALNALTLNEQTPSEELIQERTDNIFDWARVEDFQI
jgi:hypothetical protein